MRLDIRRVHHDANAEVTYTAEWREMVTSKYGTAPEITFFDAPVVVDNG